MNKHLLSLTIAALLTGCAMRDSNTRDVSPKVNTSYSSTGQLQSGAQEIVKKFAAQVALARGAALSTPPVVEVNNTPMLILSSLSCG